MQFLQEFFETFKIADLFAFSGLVMLIFLAFGSKPKTKIQLVGSLFVMSISLYADSVVVYTIAIFIIATLVTELEFLEKIAALIWNRKEYWTYLQGKAKNNEIEDKTKKQIEDDLSNEQIDDVDEVESIDEPEIIPKGIADVLSIPKHDDPAVLVHQALNFERTVLQKLNKKTIPFKFNRLKRKVHLTSNRVRYIVDVIIETKDTHYVIEVKKTDKMLYIEAANTELNSYVDLYRNYLDERNISVEIQPLIIVPKNKNLPENVNDTPIIQYDFQSQSFLNFKSDYLETEYWNKTQTKEESLAELLKVFLTKYSKWAFSPLRIQKWGSLQNDFEKLEIFTSKEIKTVLEELKISGHVKHVTSKKGNILYKINQ
ncbi:hypothetical protein [uncultured Tenacibaculum sp.]|uniref:hypothetical protein n=1 Tax=uncultured Tenacibaculum sp. TaxID=174713 RepID=UPI00261FD2CD|nr:hypothetical protein [uncultured Tenacibaculum sp.]